MSNTIESQRTIDSPPSRSCAVTLGADFDIVGALGVAATRLHVGGTGQVVARLLNDAPDAWRTYKAIPAGGTLIGRFVAVRSTGNGTSASDIVAMTY